MVYLYTPDLTVYPYVHDLCSVIFSKFKFHFTCASQPLQCSISQPVPNTWCFNCINFRLQKHPSFPHNSTLFCTYITTLIISSLFIHPWSDHLVLYARSIFFVIFSKFLFTYGCWHLHHCIPPPIPYTRCFELINFR